MQRSAIADTAAHADGSRQRGYRGARHRGYKAQRLQGTEHTGELHQFIRNLPKRRLLQQQLHHVRAYIYLSLVPHLHDHLSLVAHLDDT
jgi:hypothetical protein